MRIEYFQSPQVEPTPPGELVERPSEGTLEKATGARSDQVSLSRLSQVLAGEADREPRLDQLRMEVEAGSYQAPAEELARNLVDFHLQSEQ